MASIVLDKLSKVFRSGRQEIEALKSLQLHIPAGELLTVLGPSGSGKTTLLRLVAGLDTPTAGDIRIDDKSMDGVLPYQRGVAMVFQGGALFPHLSAYENIAVGLKLRKTPRAERELRINEAVAALQLADCLSRLPSELSTGQRQRVALARAMVRRPKIFLMDEPLANLDAPLRAELRAEIARLCAQLNATMIYVTHDQEEALSLGGRVAVLREGRLEQVAEPAVVYGRPASTFVARFIGSRSMNLIHGTLLLEAASLAFADATGLRIALPPALTKMLQPYAARPLIIGVRPEDFSITADDAAAGDSIEITVERLERTGPDVYARARFGPHPLTLRVPPDTSILPNAKRRIKPGMVHFFDAASGLRLPDVG